MPPPGGAPAELNILVGDAAAGQALLRREVRHAATPPTGDLQGIATRIAEPKALQNIWVSGGSVGGGGGRGRGRGAAAPDAPNPRAVTVTVTLPSGEKVEGRLVRIDDFLVSLLAGRRHHPHASAATARARSVEVQDPLEPHRALLLGVLTDKDMHDVTAYLVTLK